MKRLLFGLALFTLFIVACKSDSKESTAATSTDTIVVVNQPIGEISLDADAVAEENKKTPPATTPAPAEKPAASGKTTPATKPTSPAPAAGTGTVAATPANTDYLEFPSKRATYPGGEAALNKYLADNIKYPAMAREKNVQGTVYASILVDELGNIVDVSFPKPLGSGLEEEVARVIKGMPDLIPAEDHSKPVKTKYMLPVKFKLQ